MGSVCLSLILGFLGVGVELSKVGAKDLNQKGHLDLKKEKKIGYDGEKSP